MFKINCEKGCQTPGYQVRMMTGTLIAVGQHKIGVDDVQRMLDAKDKSACRYNASSCGLYLVEVKYNETN